MSDQGTPQNALMPEPSGSQPAPAGPQPSSLDQFHGQMAAHSAKMAEAGKTLDKVRSELGKLASMGDAVTAEDVIKAGGALVSHGLAPMAMASLLADMPEGGEALQGWVQQHLADVTQREQQLAQVQAQVRHQQTQAALHLLGRDHAEASAAAQPATAVPPPNGLTPGAPDAS